MGFVRPEEVVSGFKLEPGMVVADFGSGSGHYTIASANIVGDTGKVYAIDVQKDLLQAIKSTAEASHLNNVEIIWADLEVSEGSHLATGSVDFAVVSNILFQADNKEAVAKEVARVLKNGGKVAVIDWGKTISTGGAGSGFGPSTDKMISKEDVQRLFIQQGLKLQKEFQPGENHYGLIFIKS